MYLHHQRKTDHTFLALDSCAWQVIIEQYLFFKFEISNHSIQKSINLINRSN